MQNPVDMTFGKAENGVLPPAPDPAKPPCLPAFNAPNGATGEGDVTAFRVERLRRDKNYAFTLRDLLGLVKNDYEVSGKRGLKPLHFATKHLIGFFDAETKARDVKEEDLQDYVLDRRNGEKRAAEASIKLELALLKRGYNLALKTKRLLPNEVPTFPTIKQDQLKVRRKFMTTEQVHAVMGYLEADIADLVQFLYASAWRRGQAQALTWENVDDEHITAELTKSGHPHRIPIVGEVAEVIERRIARSHPDCDHVFHRRGKPIDSFRDQWRAALRQCGLPGFIVHDLRRSGVRRMVEAGGDQASIMAWTGHKTDTVFRRYMIVDDSRMRAVAEKVTRMEADKVKPARLERPRRANFLRTVK